MLLEGLELLLVLVLEESFLPTRPPALFRIPKPVIEPEGFDMVK